MAEKKSHTILWIGLLGIAGIVLYEMMGAGTPWKSSSNAAIVTALSNWANSIGNSVTTNNWMTFWQTSATQTDLNNMYALITQYWGQNVTPPADLTNYFVAINHQIGNQ